MPSAVFRFRPPAPPPGGDGPPPSISLSTGGLMGSRPGQWIDVDHGQNAAIVGFDTLILGCQAKAKRRVDPTPLRRHLVREEKAERLRHQLERIGAQQQALRLDLDRQPRVAYQDAARNRITLIGRDGVRWSQ